MNISVQRPAVLETTALGAALLAGLGVGIFRNLSETAAGWHVQDTIEPKMPDDERDALLRGWRRAVRAAIAWGKGE